MKKLPEILIIFLILVTPVSLYAKNRNFISVKVDKDTSLSEIISSSGYELEDEKVTQFLKEFMNLNEGIKSLRLIPKGNVVRLPIRYLKIRHDKKREFQRSKPSSVKDDKKEIAIMIDNFKKLFDQLGEYFSVRSGKVIIFPVTGKATLSVDTEYFPLLEISGQRLILLDIKKSLPDEIRDVIEVYWPEYTVVSSKDIEGIVNQVLDAIDYTCLNNGKVIIGDDMLVEIKPTCIITRKGNDIMNSDLIILDITKEGEFGFPENLLKWSKKSGVKIIDLYMGEHPQIRKEAKLFILPEEKEMLISDLIGHLGYEVRRNVGLVINEKKRYKLDLFADIAFKSGKRTKIVDLSGLPEQATGILRRHGIDIISLNLKDDSRKIIENILNFLSLPQDSRPEKVSEIITPRKGKYRLRTRGIVVNSRKGNLLLSDYHNAELLRSLIDNNISLIKFN